MVDSLLQKYQKIHSSLEMTKGEEDILSNLRNSCQLLENGFPDSAYVAFHFRSPFVKEGRNSDCYHLKKPILSDIVMKKYKKNKMEEILPYRDFERKFIESLLKCYLYVFGRDVSFSENCILQAERQNRISAPGKDIFLTILRNEKTEEELKKITGAADPHIFIPLKYYKCLTQSTEEQQDLIPYLVHNKVLDCMVKKTDKKSLFLLNSISDYRKVLHCLENSSESRFAQLQKRGVEVAIYYASQEKADSQIAKSAICYYKYVNHEKIKQSVPEWDDYREDDLHFFFRVIQAACVFTPLLGETLSVSPFPTYDQSKQELYMGEGNKITLAIHESSNWNELDTGLSRYLKDRHHTNIYSSLVVYGLNNDQQDRQRKHLINALRYLSLYYYSLPFEKNNTNDKKWINILRIFLKSKDQKKQSGIAKKSPETYKSLKELLGKTFFWPIVAMIGADTLRGIKHESQGACINLAIGTDVEFREVLTPIFNISDEDPFNVNVNLMNLRGFQEQLRSLIKRHFYLTNAPYRYICLKIDKGKVEIHNISDLRSDYHASTFSEVVKKIIPKSGLTVARIDSFGKANVFSKIKNKEHKLIFKCDAHDYWTQMVQASDKINSISLSDMAEVIVSLKKGNAWKNFVEDILNPTVEAVSENPLEGAVIVIAETKGDIERAISSMPEAKKFNIDHSPTDQVEYVDKESFRRHIIQDGATVIYYNNEGIEPRIQLKGRIEKKQKKPVEKRKKYFEDIVEKDQYLKDKRAMWGTRHLSCLHFIGEMWERKKTVFCIIISQDGDVHFMRSYPENDVCKHVTIG